MKINLNYLRQGTMPHWGLPTIADGTVFFTTPNEVMAYELEEVAAEDNAKRESVRVRLSNGAVWTASDGSRIVGQVEKTTGPPALISAPWVLYKVVRREGKGILTEQRYVQRVYTHAGRPPKTPPKALGDVARMPYHAHYWFYR